jgi:hypothetical protein
MRMLLFASMPSPGGGSDRFLCPANRTNAAYVTSAAHVVISAAYVKCWGYRPV